MLGLALRRLARIDPGDVPRIEIEDGWRMAGTGDTVEMAGKWLALAQFGDGIEMPGDATGVAETDRDVAGGILTGVILRRCRDREAEVASWSLSTQPHWAKRYYRSRWSLPRKFEHG